jgi:AraC-like DNA-binding protein
MAKGTPGISAVGKDTISMHLVREALEQCGAAGREAFSALGLELAMLGDEHARMPARTYGRLWRELSQALDDEFFGMSARPLRSGSFALLCEISRTQPTVGAAVEIALRFLALMLGDFHAQLIRQQTLAEIVMQDESPESRRAFACFTYWMIVHGLICWLAGRRVPILAIELRGPAPEYIDDYQVMFSRNLRFGQRHSRLVLAAEHLDIPIRRSAAELKQFLAQAPTNILIRYRDPQSLGGRVRQLLREVPGAQWPQIEGLAAHFATSTSTLRRRLAEEGCNFQSLKDSVRREQAIVWLAEASMSLEDIAERLGFADSRSFYKAFRKWTGASPGHYRGLMSGAGGSDSLSFVSESSSTSLTREEGSNCVALLPSNDPA